MNRSEILRRKADCVECKNFKPIKAKNMCQNCWHKVKRKTNKDFWASTRYTEIYQRCNNINNTSSDRYNGIEVCSREEFKMFVLNDPKFHELFELWKQSNFDFKHAPSIDRIDSSKGYIIGNIQVVTHSENSLKDQFMTPINCYTKSGEFVARYISQGEAARELGVFQANIFKCLIGERKTTGGYRFEYA